MKKIPERILEIVTNVGFMATAFFFVWLVLLKGEEPSNLVLVITFVIALIIGEIVFRILKPKIDDMMYEKSCLPCQYFHIERERTETESSIVRCKNNEEIIPIVEDIICGYPKMPGWCPIKGNKEEKWGDSGGEAEEPAVEKSAVEETEDGKGATE